MAQRAVRQDRRRHGGDVRGAGERLRSRPGRPAERQCRSVSPIPTVGKRPACSCRSCGSTIRRRCRLSDTATTDPNDQVIGIDFSGGMASVTSQLNAALGCGRPAVLQSAGTTLRVLDDGVGTATVERRCGDGSTTSSLLGGSARAAVVRRRQQPLYRRDHRGRRSSRSGSPGALRSTARSSAIRRSWCQYRRDDAVRRHHATGFPLPPAHQRQVRCIRRRPASAPRRRRSGGSLSNFRSRSASAQGAGARTAAKLIAKVRTSCSARCSSSSTATSGVNIDEEMANLADPAECVCRQCAGDVDRQGDARRVDAGLSVMGLARRFGVGHHDG